MTYIWDLLCCWNCRMGMFAHHNTHCSRHGVWAAQSCSGCALGRGSMTHGVLWLKFPGLLRDFNRVDVTQWESTKGGRHFRGCCSTGLRAGLGMLKVLTGLIQTSGEPWPVSLELCWVLFIGCAVGGTVTGHSKQFLWSWESFIESAIKSQGVNCY